MHDAAASQSYREFTLQRYAALLERTADRYNFVGFDVLAQENLAAGSFCILRHDIDISPSRALEVAQIEARTGARATYMVLLNGSFYNPLESTTRNILLEIAALGHHIGLHLDANWHASTHEKALGDVVQWEVSILRALLPDVPVTAFAFHNTSPFTMACRADRYGGLWNAYAGRIQDAVDYVSDSNGLWRFRSWADLIEEAPPRIQILTHPEWWTDGAATPGQKVLSALQERARAGWDEYCSVLKSGARPNLVGDAALVLSRPDLFAGRDWEILSLWLDGHRELGFLALLRVVARLAGVRDLDRRKFDEAMALGRRLAGGEAVADAIVEDMFRHLLSAVDQADTARSP